MAELRGTVLLAGEASGPVLRLSAPISFWGGVDPKSGAIVDPRHPDHAATLSGRVLAILATIGSSSSSAIMLELLRNGVAPAALLLGNVDAILVLGVMVARELGYPTIPVVHCLAEDLELIPQGADSRIADGGRVFWSG
jgi:predicted aconitase with swiveling domain